MLLLALLMGAAGEVRAQTAIVPAMTNQACVGTRSNDFRSCTANDLTAQISFTQNTTTAITSCIAGQEITLDAVASLQSGNSTRYNIGLFTGQTGNDPRQNNASAQCSLGVFPINSTGGGTLTFRDIDGGGGVSSGAGTVTAASGCGDFNKDSTSTLQITAIKATCIAAPNTNQLSIPYVLAWDNQADATCTAGALTASTNSKCNYGAGAYVVGVVVQGWVRITKSTNPSNATQSFSFTTTYSDPGTTTQPTLTTLNLASNPSTSATGTIMVPLSVSGGTQTVTITITEALSSGWENTATISCTTPTGGSATSYVSVNNATRQIVVRLNSVNYGAVCNITNNRQTRVRLGKSVPNSDTGTFNLSVQSTMGTTTATNQPNLGFTGYQQSSSSGSVTLTETSGSNTSITKYLSAINCTNDETGATVAVASSTLTGATRTAALTPPAYYDTTCRFTNTRTAEVSITKTNGVTSLLSGSTTAYTITVSNLGPSDADGSVLRDPAVTGLSCSNVVCAATTGTASCPAAPSVTVAALQGSGITLSSLPASSSVSFVLTCAATALGL